MEHEHPWGREGPRLGVRLSVPESWDIRPVLQTGQKATAKSKKVVTMVLVHDELHNFDGYILLSNQSYFNLKFFLSCSFEYCYTPPLLSV